MSPEQPSGRKPTPPIPSDMKAFNRKIVEEFRANHGELSGAMAGRHLMLLTTTGARSGEPRTVVLGFGKDGDRYVVVASGNGMPEHPLWYRNLLAKPTVTVEVGPEKFTARARTARPEERQRFTPLVPYVVTEQKKTTREIPLVVLERA
jgi:deazaflavin-dependent oxidoreductase (nitroreductase family)